MGSEVGRFATPHPVANDSEWRTWRSCATSATCRAMAHSAPKLSEEPRAIPSPKRAADYVEARTQISQERKSSWESDC